MTFILMLLVLQLLVLKVSSFKLDKPVVIFSFFYFLIYVLGYFFVLIITGFEEYKVPLEVANEQTYIIFYGFVIFLLSYACFARLGQKVNFSCSIDRSVSFKTLKLFKNFFLFVGVFGLALYALKNGIVLLKVLSGGYEEKNHANAGSGLFNILMALGFKLYIITKLIEKPERYFKILLETFFIGVAIFFVIGGGRASSLMLVAIVVFSAYYYGYLSVKKLVFVVASIFLLIVYMTIARYGVDISNVDDSVLVAILYKLQGSFSPIDSFLIITQTLSNSADYQFQIAFNNFYYFIPRIFWEAKPLILDNAAGYYTKEILQYGSDVTISPTLLGELFLYGGHLAVGLGMFVCAFLVFIFDIIYLKSKLIPVYRIVYFMLILNFFALMREGVGLMFRDLFFFVILFSFCMFFILFIKQFLLVKLVKRPK